MDCKRLVSEIEGPVSLFAPAKGHCRGPIVPTALCRELQEGVVKRELAVGAVADGAHYRSLHMLLA